MPISQDDMTESRVVAIWLGNHTSEVEFDDYMCSKFEGEFGFRVNERRLPEIDTQPGPIPVSDLLDGFSMCKHWIDAALVRCAELSIREASSAAVFHFLRFDNSRCKVVQQPSMTFIGNFDWPESS